MALIFDVPRGAHQLVILNCLGVSCPDGGSDCLNGIYRETESRNPSCGSNRPDEIYHSPEFTVSKSSRNTTFLTSSKGHIITK